MMLAAARPSMLAVVILVSYDTGFRVEVTPRWTLLLLLSLGVGGPTSLPSSCSHHLVLETTVRKTDAVV